VNKEGNRERNNSAHSSNSKGNKTPTKSSSFLPDLTASASLPQLDVSAGNKKTNELNQSQSTADIR
jgi:hypothetical protein